MKTIHITLDQQDGVERASSDPPDQRQVWHLGHTVLSPHPMENDNVAFEIWLYRARSDHPCATITSETLRKVTGVDASTGTVPPDADPCTGTTYGDIS